MPTGPPRLTAARHLRPLLLALRVGQVFGERHRALERAVAVRLILQRDRVRGAATRILHDPAVQDAPAEFRHAVRRPRRAVAECEEKRQPLAPDLLHKRGNIHRRRRSHIRKSQARKIFEMLLPLVRIQIQNRVIHCSLLHFQRYGILLLYMRRPVCQDIRAALPHLKLFSNKYLNVRLTKLFLSCNIKISEHTFYLLLNAKG